MNQSFHTPAQVVEEYSFDKESTRNKMTGKECWVTYGRTESGDDLVPLVFLHKPTNEEVEKQYEEIYPDEYEEVGFVGWSLSSTTIQD